jgi:hypothetical protein
VALKLMLRTDSYAGEHSHNNCRNPVRSCRSFCLLSQSRRSANSGLLAHPRSGLNSSADPYYEYPPRRSTVNAVQVNRFKSRSRTRRRIERTSINNCSLVQISGTLENSIIYYSMKRNYGPEASELVNIKVGTSLQDSRYFYVLPGVSRKAALPLAFSVVTPLAFW